MILQHTFINIKNRDIWRDDIINFISSFDDDASGANGVQHTIQKAIDNGYDNTISYLIDQCNKESLIENTHDLLHLYIPTWDSCSEQYDYTLTEYYNSDQALLIVAISE